MPRPASPPAPSKSPRERLRFPSRHALQDAAARLLEDPGIESCTIDVPNLFVEIARSERSRAVRRLGRGS